MTKDITIIQDQIGLKDIEFLLGRGVDATRTRTIRPKLRAHVQYHFIRTLIPKWVAIPAAVKMELFNFEGRKYYTVQLCIAFLMFFICFVAK